MTAMTSGDDGNNNVRRRQVAMDASLAKMNVTGNVWHCLSFYDGGGSTSWETRDCSCAVDGTIGRCTIGVLARKQQFRKNNQLWYETT